MINVVTQLSTATSQVVTADLTEKLCQPYCANASIQPIVNVEYSIDNTTLEGTILYATIKATGTVIYVPKCGSSCCPNQKVFTEYFTTSFAGATAESTITISQDTGLVKPAYVNCNNVANGISAANVVTLTFTASPA